MCCPLVGLSDDADGMIGRIRSTEDYNSIGLGLTNITMDHGCV